MPFSSLPASSASSAPASASCVAKLSSARRASCSLSRTSPTRSRSGFEPSARTRASAARCPSTSVRPPPALRAPAPAAARAPSRSARARSSSGWIGASSRPSRSLAQAIDGCTNALLLLKLYCNIILYVADLLRYNALIEARLLKPPLRRLHCHHAGYRGRGMLCRAPAAPPPDAARARSPRIAVRASRQRLTTCCAVSRSTSAPSSSSSCDDLL